MIPQSNIHLINNPRISWQSHKEKHAQTKHPTENFISQIGHNFFTSDLMEATRGQKHPSEAKNGMKELIYWKKFLMKVAQ